jgi:hypothetical protein
MFRTLRFIFRKTVVDSSWNAMAHGDAREGKWRGNWRMEWVASTLHTTSEHGVSNITTADAHNSAASSRLNWRPRRFKWTRPFRRKTKSGFCASAITFQLASTYRYGMICLHANGINSLVVELLIPLAYTQIIPELYIQPPSWRWTLGFETWRRYLKIKILI